MKAFDLFDHLRTDRGIALSLDGDKSLKRVRSFFVGFESGANSNQGSLTELEALTDFNSWVGKRLGFFEGTSGWCNMILSKAGTEEKAFDLFFELLDQYRSEKK